MNKPRNIILHVHIFKNAGTTFDFSLRRNFGDDFIDHRDDEKMVQGKQQYLEAYLEDHPNVLALSSHSVHFIPINNDRFHYFPIYLMRHPIERIRSVYDFEKNQISDSLGPQKAKELDFSEYVQWRMTDKVPATIRNCQTIFLSGAGPGTNELEKKYQLAVNNTNQSLVGITHRYDESMLHFESVLRGVFPKIDLSYTRKNITDTNLKRTLEEKIEAVITKIGNSELTKIVVSKNELDLRLFTAVNINLTKQLEQLQSLEESKTEFEQRLTQINLPISEHARYKRIELFPRHTIQLPRAEGFGEYPAAFERGDKVGSVSLFDASPAEGRLSGMMNTYMDESGNLFGSSPNPIHKTLELPKYYPGNTLSVVTPGATEIYYHWMIDLIPKLYLIKSHFGDLNYFDRIIVNRNRNEFQKRTLELLGITPNKIETIDSLPEGKFERLVTCDFLGTYRMNEVINIWANLLPAKPFNISNRRIYISREDSKKRKVINEREILTALKLRGFEKIVLSEMELKDQIALFQESKFVISPHGASLTNLLWCGKGTTVLELFSEHIMPGYFHLAKAKKLKYHFFRDGSPFKNDRTHQEKNAAPILVPKDAFITYVDQLIGN